MLDQPIPTLYACPSLTKIRFRLCVAWLGHKFSEMEKIQLEEAVHKVNCPVCSGDPLYKELWPNACVGREAH